MSMDANVNLAYGFVVPTEEAYELLNIEVPDDVKGDIREMSILLSCKPYGDIAAAVQYGEDADYEKAIIFDNGTRISLSEVDEHPFISLQDREKQVSEEFLNFVQETGFSPAWHYWVDWM